MANTPITTHTASIAAGTTLGGAVIGILVTQFRMDPGLATDWLIVLTAILGGPVMAYLAYKAKGDPALEAALNAITAISQQNQQQQNGDHPPPSVEATVTAATSPNPIATPAAATVTATVPVLPPQEPHP